MITAKTVSRGQAQNYYAADDYYTSGEPPSRWLGAGAEALGLNGEAKSEDIEPMLSGILPNGERIHRGGDGEARAALDLCVSAPKSVSLVALVGGDAGVLSAHDKAVDAVAARVEELVRARITENGETRHEFTKNATIAAVRHDTNRNGEPQLHTHCLAFNATQRDDGKWVAVSNELLFRHQKELDAIYKAELGMELRRQGFEIEKTKDGFEIAGITREQIEAFSSRWTEINAALEARGTDRESATGKERQLATLDTRLAKEEVDREKLQADWVEAARRVGLDFSHDTVRHVQKIDVRQGATEAVSFAMEHLGEREFVLRERDVVTAALNFAPGATDAASVRAELAAREERGEIVTNPETGRLTTTKALLLEKEMAASAERGAVTCAPIADAVAVANSEHVERLAEDQRAAVVTICENRDRVLALSGAAGAGKSWSLSAFEKIAAENGHKVVAIAPSHSAVEALREKGLEAQTMQGWLAGNAWRELGQNSILVLDEAGLAATKDVAKILELTEKRGARVILAGDARQYGSVEAGRAFKQLDDEKRLQVARIEEMRRQQNPQLKAAAELLRDGKGKEALQKLDVREVKSDKERHAAIAKEFAKLPKTDQAKTLILTPTNAAKTAINSEVRKELGLAGKGQDMKTFAREDLTAAEKKQVHTFEPGKVVRFEKEFKSLDVKKGETLRVVGREGDRVALEKPTGERVEIQPARMAEKALTVGREEVKEIAAGDKVRLTANEGAAHNGERGTVEKIEDGKIHVKTDSGKAVELSIEKTLPLDHAYASTGHSAQGLGVERVLKDAPTAHTDIKSAYTDVTRAVEEVVVFTEDRRILEKTLEKQTDSIKTAAHDVHAPLPPPPPLPNSPEREN